MGIFDKVSASAKKAVSDYKDNQAKKKADAEARLKELQKEQALQEAAEKARQKKILSGQIKPIPVVVNLEDREKAFLEVSANRLAQVETVVEKTTGRSKKKGVVTRAVVGGVLLGPLGALGGAATAGSKSNAVTTQEKHTSLGLIDQGSLIFTNRRLLFIGKDVLSLPYSKLVAVSFEDVNETHGSTKKVFPKYEGMLLDEQFLLKGEKAEDTELYYKAITEKLIKKATRKRTKKAGKK